VKARAVQRIGIGSMLPALPGVAPGDGSVSALQPTPRDALVLLVLPRHVAAWTDYVAALDRRTWSSGHASWRHSVRSAAG
jgi:hypothetical protein